MCDVTTASSPRQASKLAVLLDTLDGVLVSDAERASLTWLAGFEAHTVEHPTAVITRARDDLRASHTMNQASRGVRFAH